MGEELSHIKKAIRNYRWLFWFWMFLFLVDHHLKEHRLKSGLRDLVQLFRISLGTAKKNNFSLFKSQCSTTDTPVVIFCHISTSFHQFQFE